MKKLFKKVKSINLINPKKSVEDPVMKVQAEDKTVQINYTLLSGEWEDQKQRILEACIESQLFATHKAYFIDRVARIVLGKRYESFIGKYNEHHEQSPWNHGAYPKQVEERVEAAHIRAAEMAFFDEEMPFSKTVEEDNGSIRREPDRATGAAEGTDVQAKGHDGKS